MTQDSVKPVGQRDLTELVSGAVAFQTASPTRAAECTQRLASQLDDLSPANAARARRLIAWNRRLDDPETGVQELRQLADDIADDFPAWAAQSRVIADSMAAELGLIDPQTLLDVADPDPSWPRIARAGYLRNVAAALAPLDGQRARDALDQALTVLTDETGDLTYPDDRDLGSPDADAAASEASVQQLRAALADAFDEDPAPIVDQALAAARRAVDLASTPDQGLAARAELVETLRMISAFHADEDPAKALVYLNEAVDTAVHEQLAETLGQRMELHVRTDDLDRAIDDADQVAAVWTVEGLDGPADVATLERSNLRNLRGDDPQELLGTVRSVRNRMIARDDTATIGLATALMAKLQSDLGQGDAAVGSFTSAIDGLGEDEHPGFVAELHESRGRELWVLDRLQEAIGDFEVAVQGFAAAGDGFRAADASRTEGLIAHLAGDAETAQQSLDRADDVYDQMAEQGMSVDFERAWLQLARSDVLAETDPERAEKLYTDVMERAAAHGWTPLLVTALQMNAASALEEGDLDSARDFVAEGLQMDPQNPALLGMRDMIDGQN